MYLCLSLSHSLCLCLFDSVFLFLYVYIYIYQSIYLYFILSLRPLFASSIAFLFRTFIPVYILTPISSLSLFFFVSCPDLLISSISPPFLACFFLCSLCQTTSSMKTISSCTTTASSTSSSAASPRPHLTGDLPTRSPQTSASDSTFVTVDAGVICLLSISCGIIRYCIFISFINLLNNCIYLLNLHCAL